MMKTNALMARGSRGQFTGLSARALRVRAAYEMRVDARLQWQLDAMAERLKKNSVYALKGAAYELMRSAQASIVRTRRGRSGAARPGNAPHTRGIPRKSLRSSIAYNVDKAAQSAVVGPQYQYVAAVGAVHEFGGKRKGKKGTTVYPKRPFMAPALQRVLPKIPAKFKNALVGPGT